MSGEHQGLNPGRWIRVATCFKPVTFVGSKDPPSAPREKGLSGLPGDLLFGSSQRLVCGDICIKDSTPYKRRLFA